MYFCNYQAFGKINENIYIHTFIPQVFYETTYLLDGHTRNSKPSRDK